MSHKFQISQKVYDAFYLRDLKLFCIFVEETKLLNMKTILTILLTLLSFSSFSQDSIFHTDGRISIGFITKVSKNNIHWQENTSIHISPLSMVSGFKESGTFYGVSDGYVYGLDSELTESDYFNKRFKYYDIRSTSVFNFRKGNNRIMAGAVFILISGATSISNAFVKDPNLYFGLTIASATFNVTGGAFILSGARKNKKESEKIRFVRGK